MRVDNVAGRLLLARRSLFVQAASPGRSRYIPTLFGMSEVLTPSARLLAAEQLVSTASLTDSW